MTTQTRPDLAVVNEYARFVQHLLRTVRVHLGMDMAWTSEFRDHDQVFVFVDADPGTPAPQVGARAPLAGSYCSRVLDGRIPELVADSFACPDTAPLEATAALALGAYLGVPLVREGRPVGMLCAASHTPKPHLSEREVATMQRLGELLSDLQERALGAARHTADLAHRRRELEEAVAGRGRWVVLQPIVRAATGEVVALEGLTRFVSPPPCAQWFHDAADAGLRAELEVATARSALELLGTPAVPEGALLHVNLSPTTTCATDLAALLEGSDPARVVLELTEHEAVLDYAPLQAALAPWRAQGLRVAIDDAGAGYASFQHVLMCEPDEIKLDIALVRGVDTDPVRRALLRASVAFADEVGIDVVAEGVETPAQRDALVDLGVGYLQGFLFAHPEPPDSGC
ncbi:MAG: sensor domain-containing phosphodiesterase [Mycobacteriales bacterium]